MTIRVGQDAYGHHSHSQREARIQGPTWKSGKEPVVRLGIERRPGRTRTAQVRPITERHEEILKA